MASVYIPVRLIYLFCVGVPLFLFFSFSLGCWVGFRQYHYSETNLRWYIPSHWLYVYANQFPSLAFVLDPIRWGLEKVRL